MKKLLTTPSIHLDPGTDTEVEVGELTKEYIEANREILEQQKKEAVVNQEIKIEATQKDENKNAHVYRIREMDTSTKPKQDN